MRNNPHEETLMTAANQQDAQEVDLVADDLVAMLAGLELLNKAAATVVDFDDTMREFIQTVILNRDPLPAGADDEIDSFATAVTVTALSALADTDDDDLEDPINGWIRKCPRITALSGRAIDQALNRSEDVDWFATELQLPSGQGDISARLVSDNGDHYAMLIVTNGVEIASRWVTCPTIIKEAYKLAEDC
jgi:hypothetical protein